MDDLKKLFEIKRGDKITSLKKEIDLISEQEFSPDQIAYSVSWNDSHYPGNPGEESTHETLEKAVDWLFSESHPMDFSGCSMSIDAYYGDIYLKSYNAKALISVKREEREENKAHKIKLTKFQKNTVLNANEEADYCVIAHKRVMQCLVDKGVAEYSSGFGYKWGAIIQLTKIGKEIQKNYKNGKRN